MPASSTCAGGHQSVLCMLCLHPASPTHIACSPPYSIISFHLSVNTNTCVMPCYQCIPSTGIYLLANPAHMQVSAVVTALSSTLSASHSSCSTLPGRLAIGPIAEAVIKRPNVGVLHSQRFALNCPEIGLFDDQLLHSAATLHHGSVSLRLPLPPCCISPPHTPSTISHWA